MPVKSLQFEDFSFFKSFVPQTTWTCQRSVPTTFLGSSVQWLCLVSLHGSLSSLGRWRNPIYPLFLTLYLCRQSMCIIQYWCFGKKLINNVRLSSSILTRFAVGGQVVAVIGVFALDSKPLFHVSPPPNTARWCYFEVRQIMFPKFHHFYRTLVNLGSDLWV